MTSANSVTFTHQDDASYKASGQLPIDTKWATIEIEGRTPLNCIRSVAETFEIINAAVQKNQAKADCYIVCPSSVGPNAMNEESKQHLRNLKNRRDEVKQTQDDFVFRTLSDVNNQTEDVVTQMMMKAHIKPTPSEEVCRKMAIKFLWILWNSRQKAAKHGQTSWIPTQSCVDLTTTGASLTREETQLSVDEMRELWATGCDRQPGKARKVSRHFKNCKQCSKRFLAKRANQEFHAKSCGLRWNRSNRLNPQTQSSAMMLETV
jgi:hypothetical protein